MGPLGQCFRRSSDRASVVPSRTTEAPVLSVRAGQTRDRGLPIWIVVLGLPAGAWRLALFLAAAPVAQGRTQRASAGRVTAGSHCKDQAYMAHLLAQALPDARRVDPGGCPPGSPTDPDVRNSRIRLLESSLRCGSVDFRPAPSGEGTLCFASVAIRWYFVDTVSGLGVPAMFPPTVR